MITFPLFVLVKGILSFVVNANYIVLFTIGILSILRGYAKAGQTGEISAQQH